MALLSMFFTIAGFPVIINIYSYFLANILGMSFLYISFIFLIKALRSNNFTSLFFAYFFSFLLLLSHPWTFIQYFIPVLVITLMIILSVGTIILNNDVGSKQMLIYYALGLGVTDLIKFIAIRGEGGISALSTVFGFLTTFNTYWSDIVVAFSYMFGGLYSNLVLLALIIVGILVYKPENPLDVLVLLERLRPSVWIIIILLASTLFPKPAFATGPGQAVAFLMVGAVIILDVNIFKLLILWPNKKIKFSLGKHFCVVVAEIFLIYLCYIPIQLILHFLALIGIKTYEITDSHPLLGLFALATSYGLLAILPNLFLFREKDQKVLEILTVPKKIFHAAIFAFITPLIGVILITIFH